MPCPALVSSPASVPSPRNSRILQRVPTTPSPVKGSPAKIDVDHDITWLPPNPNDKFYFDEGTCTVKWISANGKTRDSENIVNESAFVTGIWSIDENMLKFMTYKTEVTISTYSEIVGVEDPDPPKKTKSKRQTKKPSGNPTILKPRLRKSNRTKISPTKGKKMPVKFNKFVSDMINTEKTTDLATDKKCRYSRVYHKLKKFMLKENIFVEGVFKETLTTFMEEF